MPGNFLRENIPEIHGEHRRCDVKCQVCNFGINLPAKIREKTDEISFPGYETPDGNQEAENPEKKYGFLFARMIKRPIW